jgi:hypothetical protein
VQSRCACTELRARATGVDLKRSRKPFVVLAVTLAVIAAKIGEKWRGWMGIEPTQDASAAPRKRF